MKKEINHNSDDFKNAYKVCLRLSRSHLERLHRDFDIPQTNPIMVNLKHFLHHLQGDCNNSLCRKANVHVKAIAPHLIFKSPPLDEVAKPTDPPAAEIDTLHMKYSYTRDLTLRDLTSLIDQISINVQCERDRCLEVQKQLDIVDNEVIPRLKHLVDNDWTKVICKSPQLNDPVHENIRKLVVAEQRIAVAELNSAMQQRELLMVELSSGQTKIAAFNDLIRHKMNLMEHLLITNDKRWADITFKDVFDTYKYVMNDPSVKKRSHDDEDICEAIVKLTKTDT